jgi:hypothetical protein
LPGHQSLPLGSTLRTAPTSTGVIDVRAIFQQGHRELVIGAMPSFVLSRKGRYGLRDSEKMFCPT